MQTDEWFSALADPTRRQIVEMLSEAPLTATEIHQAFSIAGPAVSRHLRVLRQAGVIVQSDFPGDRRVRLYSLAHQAIEGLLAWMQQLRSNAAWSSQLAAFENYVALRQTERSEALAEGSS